MFKVLFLTALYLLTAPFLPEDGHRALFATTLLIKDILLWMLPVTVSFFIAHAISSFEKRAPLFIITLLIFEFLSNQCCVWYAYGTGSLVTNLLPPSHLSTPSSDFSPLFRLPLLRPSWWSADKGSMLGLILGLIPVCRPFIARGKHILELILTKFFARLIPIFLLGFIARIYKTNLLGTFATEYSAFLITLVVFLALYIALLFLIGSPRNCVTHAKHLLPAATLALSSGCSISTMPWTIAGAAKTLRNPELASAVIPATTNIQQIGDCIINCFLCYLLYCNFHGSPPPLTLWIPFSFVFVLARFATAAVIGGAIFVMLPIYETYLHFTPEMIAVILAFNVLLDPLVTCTNVLGNGAAARIFENLWMKVNYDRKKIVS